MFLDKFNENNTIEMVDETKYKSVFDLQLECIQSEYELDCMLESTALVIVNESVSDKLKKVGEYLKKLWNKIIIYIKKMKDWIIKKFTKVKNKIKDYSNKDIIITKPFTLKIIEANNIKYISLEELMKMFDIIGFTARDEESRQVWINKCKELNLDEVKTKVQEKLAQALGISLDNFKNSNNYNEKIIDVYNNKEVKVNNIDDFKKTKYYNYIKNGSMKVDNETTLNQIVDNMYKFSNGNLNLHISESLWDETIPSFKSAISIFADLNIIIANQYKIYHNFIFYLVLNEVNNYNIAIASMTLDAKLGDKAEKSIHDLNDRKDDALKKREEMINNGL